MSEIRGADRKYELSQRTRRTATRLRREADFPKQQDSICIY